MNQFTFSGREKQVTLGMMGLGLLCIVLGLFVGPETYRVARVWSNVLHNSVFFLGISFVTFLLLSAHTAAQSGWHTVFKRVMEAVGSFIPVGGVLVLIVVLGAVFHLHELYHWNAPGITDPESANYDKIIAGKSGFLNIPFFVGGTILFVGTWFLFYTKIRGFSLQNDATGDITSYKKNFAWSAAFLPVGGVTSAAVIWFWIMSVEPHWYSTLYAWYGLASWLVTGVAVVIMLLHYLRSRGYYQEVMVTHFHDLGKYMFGFSVFWMYLWFSQYMLIWYANIGEETVHFQYQLQNFRALFFAILFLNFVLPFLSLIRNSTKWKQGSAVFVAVIIFIGHWLDYYLMVKPGVLHAMQAHGAEGHGSVEHGAHGSEVAHETAEVVHHTAELIMGFNIPGLIEVGTMLGFAGLFLYVVFTALTKAALVPAKDPFIQESLHHIGGPLGPEVEQHH